ncbi:SulP family inorganic anion transporter [Edwardsiella anguillarum]|nr:SulP family inorganic anion transporter [Edwardsiella anguillarum]
MEFSAPLDAGLYQLTKYRREWLADDLRAGLSVAAVALPTALAYADLVGVTAVVGIYSCILPMIAYALFGSSRQVIVGPDAATCAVIAAVVAPLAAGDPQRLWQLCVMMTLMTGLWCLVASRFRLGALADLLSRPILTGLLNGLAITIMIDQLAKMLGYQPASREVIERILSLPHDLLSSHWPTLLLSLLTLLSLLGLRRLRPGWPAALLVIILAMLVVWLGAAALWHSDDYRPRRDAAGGAVAQLSACAAARSGDALLNLALISFVSLMLTARSFASKNGYEINPDAEFRALGVANIVSALSQGFAISGASSRTAVNDANGGKSQLVSIVAALSIAAVLLLLGAAALYSGGRARRGAGVRLLAAAGHSLAGEPAETQSVGLSPGAVHLCQRAAGGGYAGDRAGRAAGTAAVFPHGVSPQRTAAGGE